MKGKTKTPPQSIPDFMYKRDFAGLAGFASAEGVRKRIYRNPDLLEELYACGWNQHNKMWNRHELIVLKKYFGVPKDL